MLNQTLTMNQQFIVFFYIWSWSGAALLNVLNAKEKNNLLQK